MRERLAVLLVMAIGGFVLGMLISTKRAQADGEGLVHVYRSRDIEREMGKNDKGAKVVGRVVGFACEGASQGPIPVSGPGLCYVLTQEQ